MAKKKVEAEVKEITNQDLYDALVVMDKKINIITNVMLHLNEYLDKKANGKLGAGS